MKKAKKLLCLVLTLMTLMSMCALGLSAQAAVFDSAEVSAAYPTAADDFTWDNATVYFLLTDRFNNGNTANDHSYNRGLNRDGSVNTQMDTVASFQGGDFKGITQKIEAGYFDDLGVNAIWVSGWFEQIHGYAVGGDGKKSFAHYAYHGYYGSDFSELDKNYGTEAEFKEMIDTAHEHGIRIVLDVVLNHPGYNTVYDMNEYGFGTLKSGWEDKYYDFSNINQNNYHGVIDYDSDANAWGKWWGTDWVRAGLAGYKADGTNELTNSQTFLPDFKTESEKVLELPELLKTKWNKEGTYQTKMNELNATFQKYNLGNKTVRNYLVAWYTQWVEQYGVDGFRCDTAKHVELESWKALSTACTKALANWRTANPTAPGADWDEEFWMTGENYGQGVDHNNYYQNGFDSMINFSFSGSSSGQNCNGVPDASNINNTYSDYANKINTKDNFNVLTYISSHDTGLCRNNIYYQGSAFMLLPGGIQLFYGDETNRQTVDCSIPDHRPRSFMNWAEVSNSSSEAAKVLAHWQKVGTFRNDHVAVGAGSHTNLTASSGTAFARNYAKNGVTDTVACVIGANANSNVTINLGSAFANGTVVRNAYDGKTATVENGKVTFSSGAQGTILVEVAGEEVPTIPTNPTQTTPTESTPVATNPTQPVGATILGDADQNGKVNVKDATTIQKHAADLLRLEGEGLAAADADGSGKVNVKDATAIQKHIADMETGFAIGEVMPGTTTPDVTEPSTQATEPAGDTIDLTQIGSQVIVLINAPYDSPHTHTWTDGGGAYDEWPGTAMESVGKGMYFALVDNAANMIIFNDGVMDSGNQTDNLSIPGNFAIYDGAANAWAGSLTDYVDVTKFPLDPSLLPEIDPTEPTPTYPNSGNTTLSNKFVAIIYCEASGTDDVSRNKEVEFSADGTLTYDFAGDSYVFVRNYDTGVQYCTDGWTNFANPVTLINEKNLTGTFDKMYVPEGQHTLYLADNGNDTYTLSYDTGAVVDPVEPAPTTPDDSEDVEPTPTPTPGGNLSNKFVAIVYCEASGTDDVSRNKEVEFSADGTLTYDFAGDSYVFVRNYDTGVQYCTDGWTNFANPVTLINEKNLTGTFDKMYVPEGQHTLYLVDNGNDTYTLSY